MPVQVATEAPTYTRDGRRSLEALACSQANPGAFPDLRPEAATEALTALIARPNLASKREVFRQYDHQVLANTVVAPGGDAAVLRVPGTTRGIAVATDGNGRYCQLDARNGGAIAVAEAARNVGCTGARPVAVTDCLNFGAPENLEVYATLAGAVDGIAAACEAFGTPVVSGNVSLYNESGGAPVWPTPVIGMLGVLEDVHAHLGAAFERGGGGGSGCWAERSSSRRGHWRGANTWRRYTERSSGRQRSTSRRSRACTTWCWARTMPVCC